MTNERQAFLDMLTENEDDVQTRMIYADWLWEHDEFEESDRQRKWPAAKAWLVEFCRQVSPHPDDEWPMEQPISYQMLVEKAAHCIQEGSQVFYCGDNMTLLDAMQEQAETVWENLSIVTGLELPPGFLAGDSRIRYRCAC